MGFKWQVHCLLWYKGNWACYVWFFKRCRQDFPDVINVFLSFFFPGLGHPEESCIASSLFSPSFQISKRSTNVPWGALLFSSCSWVFQGEPRGGFTNPRGINRSPPSSFQICLQLPIISESQKTAHFLSDFHNLLMRLKGSLSFPGIEIVSNSKLCLLVQMGLSGNMLSQEKQ